MQRCGVFRCFFVPVHARYYVYNYMEKAKKILFLTQEIEPYVSATTQSSISRALIPAVQETGREVRTFTPKWGHINERRNQLHEVIRLSGMNLIIDDTDHPLIIKVASLPSARMQIYFIDNDDYFMKRGILTDKDGKEYTDNCERAIFYARGVLETVKKLRWTPDVIYCSGWMSALVPLYVKKLYFDTPFFENTKVVLALDDAEYKVPFSSKFAEKTLVDSMLQGDVRSISGLPVGYEDLMRLAIDNSDAVVLASENVNSRLLNYAENRGKQVLPYVEESYEVKKETKETKGQIQQDAKLMEFCKSLLPSEQE